MSIATPIQPRFSPDLPCDAHRAGDWRLRLYGHIHLLAETNSQPLSAKALWHHLLDSANKPRSHRLTDFDGAFIVVMENTRRQQAWILGDPLGNWRPHWIDDNQRIYLAERPAPLLPLLARNKPVRLKRQRLIEHFAAAGVSGDGCFFRDMRALLPGHVLHIRHISGRIHTTENAYYRLPEDALWRHIKSTQQTTNRELDGWATRLRQSLSQALDTPANQATTPAISLSGGLDSGLLAGLLARRNKRPLAISYHFARFPEADESRWTMSYTDMGLATRYFDASNLLPLNGPWPVLPDAPTSTPYRHIKDRLYQLTCEANSTQLLTGVYADHLHSGWIYHGMDRWRQSPRQALDEMTRATLSWRQRLAAFAPGKWRRPVRPAARWLTPEAQDHLRQVIPWPAWHSRHPHPRQALLVAGLYAADSVWLEDIFARQAGIGLKHPYRDRRVVETLMQAPAWVLGRPGEPKQLARAAARPVVPQAIIQRRQARSLVPVFKAGVLQKNRDMVQDTLNQATASWQDFVDKKTISELLNAPNKPQPEAHYVALWQCLSYELWRARLTRDFAVIVC